MNSIKLKSDISKKNSNIILAIIYLHQNYRININTELIFQKFKEFDVKKIKIINQEDSIKSLIEFKLFENVEKVIRLFHNTFDFYGKWKIYSSKKKNIIISKNNSNALTESIYKDNISNKKSINEIFNDDLMTPISYKKKENIFTPQYKNISKLYNKNYNFDKLSKDIIQNNIYKKTIILNKYPNYFNLNEIFNFFGLFGNISIFYYKKTFNKSIIIYDNLLYEDRLRFLKYINIKNSEFIIDFTETQQNSINLKEYEKFIFKNKYNRYIDKNNLIFPSNIIKIINIDNQLSILNLYKIFNSIEKVKVNKFKKVIKNNKIRFYFQFTDFYSTIKILSLFHLKKIYNKKLYLQLTSFKIKIN